MSAKKKAIIIGSGAGGATMAKMLSKDFDVTVLEAGGIGTPQVLRNSGIECSSHLFVDPVLCVAAPMASARQNRQLLMPFVSEREGYIISPYIDWLSYFFNRQWRKPMDGMISLMIKMANEELPLTSAEAESLHSPLLPDNLYVADASLLPQALGLPPILTIMALAKRISKIFWRANKQE